MLLRFRSHLVEQTVNVFVCSGQDVEILWSRGGRNVRNCSNLALLKFVHDTIDDSMYRFESVMLFRTLVESHTSSVFLGCLSIPFDTLDTLFRLLVRWCLLLRVLELDVSPRAFMNSLLPDVTRLVADS